MTRKTREAIIFAIGAGCATGAALPAGVEWWRAILLVGASVFPVLGMRLFHAQRDAKDGGLVELKP